MPWGIPVAMVVSSLVSAGVSAYQSSASATAQKKAADNQKATLEMAATNAKNAPAAAAAAAKEAQAKKKRASMLSGGETDVTKGQATLGETDLQAKSLLGG